ncbi:MAG: alkaline phosphatase family protein, partial [Candidatus Poribacteria bacterium]|nr:alkaline phosphatase family protein [Candidatus Poribacteria bacterium]
MESTESHFKRFIFIIIDGAPYEIFKALIENGDLPNIKKHVVDRGSLNKAVSAFPSTTGPAFIPFFMGLYPGTANIPGIRWLSKSNFHMPHRFKRPGICSYMGPDGLRFEADLPPGSPTLFNFFSPVSNIYNLLARGCPPAKNLTRRIKPFLYTYAHFSHRWRFVNQIAV